MILKSKRKNNFLNKNECLNFFKNIENKIWIDDIYDLNKSTSEKKNLFDEIVSVIKKILNINPKNRNL
jgi:hypothetical protein